MRLYLTSLMRFPPYEGIHRLRRLQPSTASANNNVVLSLCSMCVEKGSGVTSATSLPFPSLRADLEANPATDHDVFASFADRVSDHLADRLARIPHEGLVEQHIVFIVLLG